LDSSKRENKGIGGKNCRNKNPYSGTDSTERAKGEETCFQEGEKGFQNGKPMKPGLSEQRTARMERPILPVSLWGGKRRHERGVSWRRRVWSVRGFKTSEDKEAPKSRLKRRDTEVRKEESPFEGKSETGGPDWNTALQPSQDRAREGEEETSNSPILKKRGSHERLKGETGTAEHLNIRTKNCFRKRKKKGLSRQFSSTKAILGRQRGVVP